MERDAHPSLPSSPSWQPWAPSALALALGADPPAPRPAALVGLEHEYSLVADGTKVDFRELIHELPVGGRRLDPGDRNAYRLPSGLVLTCDAEDAEVVSPPVPVQPGFTADLEAWAGEGRAELTRVVPPGLAVVPFSTHLSASMPDDIAGPACALFAVTFAPALMLLLDGPASSGVFVRPRPGRLELCGEHAHGARLRAAAALVAGGARACAGDHPGLPPRLAVDLRPATGRYGLFVGRHLAFGFDLYAAPRTATLPLAGGGTIFAEAYLEAAWQAVRTALGTDAGAGDLADGDAMVSGARPLGVEGPDAADPVAPRRPPPSPFGAILVPRSRPGFDVAAEAATWDFTVLRLRGRRRDAFASVPGALLDAFLRDLDAGRLDDLLLGFLDAGPTGRVLDARRQALTPDLWDDAVIGPDLLPYERSAADPGTPLVAPAPDHTARHGKVAVPASSAVAVVQERARAVPGGPSHPPSAPQQPAGAPPPPAAAPPPAHTPVPAPEPPIRPHRPHRRQRVWVVAGTLLALVLAGAAAALTGALSDGGPTQVEVVAGPPGTSPTTASVPPASVTEPAAGDTTSTGPPTTVAPITTIASTASTAPTTPAVVTTQAVTTTAAPATSTSTSSSSTSTTSTTAAPVQLVVVVTPTALGCGFSPPSATSPPGSSIRFRNDTPAGVNLTVTPPVGATTTITLEQRGTSAAVPLDAPGTYTVTCIQGDGVFGRMTVTVAGA